MTNTDDRWGCWICNAQGGSYDLSKKAAQAAEHIKRFPGHTVWTDMGDLLLG